MKLRMEALQYKINLHRVKCSSVLGVAVSLKLLIKLLNQHVFYFSLLSFLHIFYLDIFMKFGSKKYCQT